MSRLLVLRHAESEWNAQGRWQGMADPPLSARGERQAELAGSLLSGWGFDAVASSGLRRARDTALRICRALDGPEVTVEVDPDLREYDLGAWSGLTRVEIEAGWAGEVEAWRQGRLDAPPGGEHREAFVARVQAALRCIAIRHPGRTVLVITHGGVLSAIARQLGIAGRRYGQLCGMWVEINGRGDALSAGRDSEVSVIGLTARRPDDGEGIEVAGATVPVIGDG